jgi:hypothetical protein
MARGTENVLPHLVVDSVRFKDKQQCDLFSAAYSVNKKIYLHPTSNAEIMQPYLLVACITSEKETADETEDTAYPYPSYAGHLLHCALQTAQS